MVSRNAPAPDTKPVMTNAYVIQIAGTTAGLVARDHAEQAFHFFASNPAFRSLEGRSFAAPLQAERAARQTRGGAGAAVRQQRFEPKAP